MRFCVHESEGVGDGASRAGARAWRRAADLLTLAITDFVESVVADIEETGLGDVVLVGHSMAGLTVPGVVTKLGSSRVREMILATAFVPPEGKAIVDTITGLFARIARRRAAKRVIAVTPAWMVRLGFLNGTPRAQRKFMPGKLYPESPDILAENVSRRGMPDDVPRTWILTRRDRALSVKLQRRGIDAIGGVQTLVELDTCHMLMVSEPERLAEILVDVVGDINERRRLVQALVPLAIGVGIRCDAAADAQHRVSVSVELDCPDRHAQLTPCDR